MRQNLYLDREVSLGLERLAAGSRGMKSRLANDALKAWFARGGHREIDDLLKPRLDRLSREIDAARRDIDIVLESLALFIRYQLMVTPPLAESDEAGRAQGRERFANFIAQVGRQIASGRKTLADAEGGEVRP